jgi:hypothetical protein
MSTTVWFLLAASNALFMVLNLKTGHQYVASLNFMATALALYYCF